MALQHSFLVPGDVLLNVLGDLCEDMGLLILNLLVGRKYDILELLDPQEDREKVVTLLVQFRLLLIEDNLLVV